MYPPCQSTVPGRRAVIALMAAITLAAGACGSRLDEQALERAEGPFRPVSAPAAVPGPAPTTDIPGEPVAAPADDPAIAGHAGLGAGPASTAPGNAGRGRGITPEGEGISVGSSPASSPRPAPDSGAASPVPAPANLPAGPAAAPTGPKSEILLGSWGTESGILGAVTGPAPPAIRAWTASINAGGGINGHPVRVIMGDDNADPARSLAIVRQMVERDHVIAFFNEYSFTLSTVTKYLEERQIPVIGSIGGDAAGDHSPMVFNPLVGPDKGQAWGFLLTVASQTDKKKLGIVYCREAATCAVQVASFRKLLPWNGLESVYEAQVSLAQPDYTAEMLQAQRAGAEVIVSLVDSASLARLAQAAHRQGYNPTFSGTYNLNQDLVFAGGKEVEGLLLTSRTPPWDSSPKLRFYRDAMDRYQPRGARGDLGGGVFVAGKLFAEKIGPFIGEPPKTADILQGVYALRNERLGGLLPGVGFSRGAHFDTNQCIVPVRLTGGRFRAHDAAESFVCAPGWKPVGG